MDVGRVRVRTRVGEPLSRSVGPPHLPVIDDVHDASSTNDFVLAREKPREETFYIGRLMRRNPKLVSRSVQLATSACGLRRARGNPLGVPAGALRRDTPIPGSTLFVLALAADRALSSDAGVVPSESLEDVRAEGLNARLGARVARRGEVSPGVALPFASRGASIRIVGIFHPSTVHEKSEHGQGAKPDESASLFHVTRLKPLVGRPLMRRAVDLGSAYHRPGTFGIWETLNSRT